MQVKCGKVQQPAPVAEAGVGLLQGNNVGIDLADDFQDADRIKDTIGSNAFVNVV